MIDAKKTKSQLISELETIREMERMYRAASEAGGESDRRLRLLADSVPVSICYIDRDERYRFNNKTMCRWIGQDAAALQGKQVREVMPPEAYRKFHPYLSRVLAGETLEYEDEIIFPDGKTRKLHGAYIPDMDAEGQVLGFSSMVEDITERKRTEEELKDSRLLLQTVFDALPQRLSLRGKDKNLLMVNTAAAALRGLSPEEYIKMPERYPALQSDDVETIDAINDRVLREGEIVESDREVVWADGRKGWNHSTKVPFRDSEGNIEGVITLIEDVTERKRAEQELKKNRQLLQTVFDTIPSVLTLRDKDKKLLMVNKAAASMRNLTPDEYLRLPETYPALRKEDGEIIEAIDDQILREGQILEYDREVTWSNGEEGWYHTIKAPFRDSEGNIEGVVTLIENITRRKQSEQKLQDSRQLLQTVFDTIPSVLTLRGKNKKLLMVNKAAASRRNLTPDEYLRLPESYPALGKEAVENIEAMDERIIREGKTLEFDREVTWANGERVWYHTIKAPFRDSEGNIEGVVTLMENITGRKQSEQELENSRRLLRTVFDTVPARLTVKNKYNRIIMVNKSAAATLNVTPEEFLRLPEQYPALRPEDIEKYQALDERILREGEAIELEGIVKWKNGKEGWYQSYRVPFKDSEGNIEGLVVVSEDITKRKKAEESLKESRKLLLTVFDTIPHWLIVKDKESRYLMVNKALANSFGMDPDEFIGLGTKEVTVGITEEREKFLERDQEIFRSGEPVSWDDVTVTLPSGQQTIRHISKMPLRNEEDEIVGLVALSEDITQRKLTEEQLLHSQKMEAIGQLTGGVAHEFNNLLQIILGYTQIAISMAGKDSDISEQLQKVVQSSERASGLTKQLLAFGRKEAHRPIRLDIHSQIEYWLNLMDKVFGERVTIELDLDIEPCAVFADPAMIQQVLLNLCINAQEAMPEGGLLSVATKKITADEDFRSLHPWADKEGYVAISIRDSGMGMPPEVREKVFEPFFTTKEVGQGTGLGLSTAYGIVQQHGGNILVHSSEGMGTTFTVYLPTEESKSATIKEDVQVAGPSGKETILVAEDEEEVLTQIAFILESKGFKVLKAKDGVEALQVLLKKSEEVDLALLDVVMPHMSGREVYLKIKEIDPTIPVLFSTGYASNSLDTDFLSRNRVGLIQKPYSPVELYLAVRNELDKSNKSRSQ